MGNFLPSIIKKYNFYKTRRYDSFNKNEGIWEKMVYGCVHG